MNRLIDRLKKIERLAESGIEGERESAKRLLNDLCQRHNVTLEQLCDDKKEWVKFIVKNRIERKILFQVVSFICKTDGVNYKQLSGSRNKSHFYFELNAVQIIDIKDCFKHYRKLWLVNLDDVLSAFIYSNRIFSPSSGEEVEIPSVEEIARLERISAIMAGMNANPWKKVLRLTA